MNKTLKENTLFRAQMAVKPLKRAQLMINGATRAIIGEVVSSDVDAVEDALRVRLTIKTEDGNTVEIQKTFDEVENSPSVYKTYLKQNDEYGLSVTALQ